MLIDRRFRGPPNSANGGYTCGLVAQHLGWTSAEVSLRKPPPIESPLRVDRADDRVLMLEDATVIAEGVASDFDLAIPDPPTLDQASAAVERYPWAKTHPFPECFTCGPARHVPDGLRLLLGPIEGRELFATPWVPDTSLADSDGIVPPIFMWAALDCPTAVAVPVGRPSVLARLRVRLGAPAAVERPHLVIAWAIDRDGRKRLGGAAITALDGTVCGVSEGLWIELRDPASHQAATYGRSR